MRHNERARCAVPPFLFNYGLQFALGVFACHAVQRKWLYLSGLARAAERLETRLANIFGGSRSVLEIFARIELALILRQMPPDRASHCEADVGIDIYFAHAMFNSFLDFLDGNTIGFFHFPTILADDIEPFLRYRAGSVHNEGGIGNATIDLLYALDGEYIARWLAGKFIRTMGRANGDRQSIHTCLLDEISGLFRVS